MTEGIHASTSPALGNEPLGAWLRSSTRTIVLAAHRTLANLRAGAAR